DFTKIMDNVRAAIKTIEPNDSIERYEDLGVRCIQGYGKLTSPWSVEVEDQTYSAANIILATGASPQVPPIAGLSAIKYLTSDTIWDLHELPKKLAILGGGPIGCELAQCFQRLGSKVTIVEMADRLLPNEDHSISKQLQSVLRKEGVSLLTGYRAELAEPGRLTCRNQSDERKVEFDQLLVATGRSPRVSGFGLEELDIEIDSTKRVRTNPYLQTNFSHIYACGDLTGPWQFTHAASHEAWHASVNALFSPLKKFKVGYKAFPWCIYTDPEIAGVGITETEATASGLSCEVTEFNLADLDRAITEQKKTGVIRVITKARSDKILGARVIAPSGGELISLFTFAMHHGIGLNGILSTVFPYPTYAEGLKRTAGMWKKNQTPTWLLPWLARYHRFRRGAK
ncbi:MAG: pyruvate/2-oxoglutarate dehydrogenase complex dihydrolipoamide dehydrogenase (E3) component, partial [Gammaproteobacteria bacterium]